MPVVSRYDPRTRYRHRAQQRMSVFAAFGLVAAICGAIGYGVGYQAPRFQVAAIQTQLIAVEAERDQLQQTVTRLMADSHSANIKVQQIEEQLQSELPSDGPMKDIVTQIRGQLQAGVPADRLAEMIKTLSPPKNCVDPETRRFIVQTPNAKSSDVGVVLGGGALTIKAMGDGARGKNGTVETWYDPSRPVALSFVWMENGASKTIERKGNLPISQVVVVGNREYRMTFAEGVKSYIKLSYDSCDYP